MPSAGRAEHGGAGAPGEVARIEAFAPTPWGDIATGDGAVWLSVNGRGDGADAIRFGTEALRVVDHKHGELWKIDVRKLH